MRKTKNTLRDLMRMAEKYGVADNALFVSAVKQYALQMKVIETIQNSLDQADMTTTKSYVKGIENVYANPLVRELPKHSDAANRTAQTMLDIIKKLGVERPVSGKLSEMMADD